MRRNLILIALGLGISFIAQAQESGLWLNFEPRAEKITNKHIVLISGDEEYRSEEGLPMLAKLLAKQGFRTTVLFSIDPKTGWIDPNFQNNIPGLQQLETADLMIIQTRFRALPDDQMEYIDEYLRAGKPVIGLRTATHAFNFPEDAGTSFGKYSFDSKVAGWENGFGKKVLGETWIAHHGHHGKEGTRGLVDGISKLKEHPVLTGVEDIWGSTDVYTISDIPEGATVLLWGQSTSGMTADAPVNWHKSIIPVAWTKTYQYDETSPEGRVFTTTMGAATDLTSEDFRRLVINAAYWATGLEDQITEDISVEIPFSFNPTPFGFNGFVKGKKPEDYE